VKDLVVSAQQIPTTQRSQQSSAVSNNSSFVQQEAVPTLGKEQKTFGFIDTHIIRALHENNPWQERTQAIEQLEQQIS
jgi:hypothetical protein